MAFVIPAVAIPYVAAVGSAVITGIASYFTFGRKSSSNENAAPTTTGEINNNVQLAVEENNNQNNVLVILITFLLLIKLTEVIIYAINSYKRTMKKRYRHNATAVTEQV